MEQRQERQKKKDDEKQKRVSSTFLLVIIITLYNQLKTKAEMTMAEMMYGSKPVTPVKRYHPLSTHV